MSRYSVIKTIKGYKFFSVTLKKFILLVNSKVISYVVLTGLIIVSALITITQLFSYYYAYGGESLELASIMRVSHSLPYVSRPNELPILFSQYSPVLFWLIDPLIKFMGSNSLREIVLISRVFIISVLFLYSYILNRFFIKYNIGQHKNFSFTFAVLWFFVMFPGDILSVSADFLSFLFEFLSFSMFYDLTFNRQNNLRKLLLAAIFAGIAISIKVNSVGVFLGIVLFLLLNRFIYFVVIYCSTTILTVVVIFIAFYWSLGDRFTSVILAGILNEPLPIIEVLRKIGMVFFDDQFHFSVSIFYILVLVGLYNIKGSRRKVQLYSCCLGMSFAVATLSQARIGAYLNYHFGFFMLAVIPVSIALNHLFESSQKLRNYNVLHFVVMLIVSIQLLISLKFPVRILIDNSSHAHERVTKYLMEKHPTDYIYTDISAISLRLLDKTLLGPWAEWEMQVNPFCRSYIPEIRNKLKKIRFTVAVVDQPDCKQWKPSGIFLNETRQLVYFKKEIGDICIFTENKSTFSSNQQKN